MIPLRLSIVDCRLRIWHSEQNRGISQHQRADVTNNTGEEFEDRESKEAASSGKPASQANARLLAWD
jgi:hypothetical protein